MNWRRRWRPRKYEPQVANAHPGFLDLTPASDAPAEQTRSNWSALQPGQDVPLIWEDSRHGRHQEGRARRRG